MPARINNKLVFTLCALCTLEKLSICRHTNSERAFTGTWVSLEIDKAKEKGYKILEYYEVWHWNEREQYDPKFKRGGIFTDYINQALKEKQEADGYPSDVKTEADKQKYIQDYYENEGILLDINSIAKNKSKKLVAKLKANSEWGYLAMNCNKTQMKIIYDVAEWYKMLEDKQYTIHDVCFFDDKTDCLQVFYSKDEKFNFSNQKTNVVLASFVTCQARLHLYKELERLNERVLYFDTDSIIFLTRPTDTYHPSLGQYLGQFKSEVNKAEGDYIDEFVSAGPKNYAYKYNTGISHCTIKGITQNYLTSLKINFKTVKEIVCNEQGQRITVQQLKFIRNKKKWSLQTNIQDKQYGFVYDKRVLNDDLTTLPFGF